MLEIGSPEWIQASLEKLEVLEQERDEHETALEAAVNPDALRIHSEAIDRLDEEIKALYAQLESVAEDDPSEDEASLTAAVRTAKFSKPEDPRGADADDEEAKEVDAPALPSETGADMQEDDDARPYASPPAASQSTSGMTTSSSFDAASDTRYDFDPPAKGGAAKWVIVGLLLVGVVGGGGWFYMNKMNKPPPPTTQDAGPTQVIKAGAVPDDTEEPNYVKGQAGATSTPTQDFSKGGRRSGGGGAGGGGGGGGGGPKPKGKDGHSISIAGGDDPL